MIRTIVTLGLLAVLAACGCAPGFLTAAPQTPQASASPAPAGIKPNIGIEFKNTKVYVSYKDESLVGVDVKSTDLPLAKLIASASDVEFDSVGLKRDAALATLEKSGWRLHRRVTTFKRREDEKVPQQDSVANSLKLNLAFLASGSPTIAMDNMVSERFDDVLKPYSDSILDGVSEAGDEVFSATGIQGSWVTSTEAPPIGEGILSIFTVSSPRSSRLPRHVTSSLVGDMINIKDVVAGMPAGLFEVDIQWMEGRKFPAQVIGAFVQMRVRERVAQQLFEGIGIDDPWPVTASGTLSAPANPEATVVFRLRPGYLVIRGTASGSVGTGSSVLIEESRSKTATGSYTIRSTDLVFEEDGKVYIQTSTDPDDEHETRQVLGKLARLAAKKLIGTLKPQ